MARREVEVSVHPRRARKTELAALGLISRRPMHGYAINQAFRELGFEHWTTISRSSVYGALRRLARSGAVSITREREGRAPERTVYHLTEHGRRLLREILAEAIGYVGAEDRYFYLGLSFLANLETEEALAHLRRRGARLEEVLSRESGHGAELEGRQTPLRHIRAMRIAGRRHLEVELDCCREIIALLEGDSDYLVRIREMLHAD
jgi:DNA-binding PadR family transcriptional regulator